MKQTAVEWLESQIKNSKHYFHLMKEIQSIGTVAQPNIFEQAKEMEKEQIEEAFAMGNDDISSEQYYNETYERIT
jgi:ribonuclease I